MHNIRLGVNIDHIATIRNARGGKHPDPLRAALLAEEAGADGITAHLREDRRHISDSDIYNLKSQINLPLNFEIAPTDEMFAIALKTLPNAVCLVPEKREEITTEGGLNINLHFSRLKEYIGAFKSANIRVSLFLEPDLSMIDLAKKLDVDIIEFHTGRFCNLVKSERDLELQKIQIACNHANNLSIECHAGHGLNFETSKEIIQIREIRELNIGHFLVGEAIFDGFGETIKKMKKIISGKL
ncbi:MAG: pyridoxine 5'-phosphate synthase [Rickettsiales bacterium]|jgi:pyridoxine 5-phosphate synthase|nr:pyridoxine 5'-phosphate synthase [Rickettsiales bacterium]